MTYDVFLSYARADEPKIEAFARRLRQDGLEPFLDKWHLVPGDRWQESLEDALEASRTCAVFVGKKLGPWQHEEMRDALNERVRNKGFRVIPVLLPGVPEPDKKNLPRFLRSLTWVDFRNGLDDEDAYHRLVGGIRGVAWEPGPKPEETASQASGWPSRPWRWGIAVAATVLVLLAIAIYVLWPRRSLTGSQKSLTVAVLGFAPRESDSEREWLAPALAEALSADLRTHRRVQALPGEWTAQFRRSIGTMGVPDEDELARLRAELSPSLADVAVTGVWEVENDQLSVDLTLRDLKTGRECTLEVAGSPRDLTALARGAVAKIEARMHGGVPCSEETRAFSGNFPTNPDTFRLYAAGLEAWRNGDFLTARESFEKALKAEPEHPMLHLVYGQVLWDLGYTLEAENAALKALAQANRLARVPRLEVTAASHRLLGQWEAAAAAYKELLEADPREMVYGLLWAEVQAQADLAPEARAEALNSLASFREKTKGVLKGHAELAEARLRLDQGELQLAKGLALQAVVAGRSTGVSSLESEGRLVQAIAHDRLGELEDALDALKQAQTLLAPSARPRQTEAFLAEEAIILAQMGDLEEARQRFEYYRRHYAEHDDELGEAIVGVNLAYVLIDLGEVAEAEALARGSAEVFQRRGDLRKSALAEIALGTACYHMDGRLKQARESYEKGLDVFRRIGDRENVAISLGNIGEVLYLAGELQKAKDRYLEALAINREIANKRNEGYDLFSLGQIAVQRDRADEARRYFEESRKLADELPDVVLNGYIQLELARLAILEGLSEEAERLARAAESTFQEIEMPDYMALAQIVQVEVFLKRQPPDLDAALELGGKVVIAASGSENRFVRFEGDLLATRLDAAGGADVQKLRRKLEELADKAQTDRLVLAAFAARLLLGELEIKSDTAKGRARLEDLRSAALKRRLPLFERQAARLLKSAG